MQEVSNPQAFWEWVFSVTHTHEMLAKLKTDYYPAWRGEGIDL
jgi:hypothetical protein